MKAHEMLEQLVCAKPGDWVPSAVEVTSPGEYVAEGVLTDPDGCTYRIKVERLDA